jgi:hypothetical protein
MSLSFLMSEHNEPSGRCAITGDDMSIRNREQAVQAALATHTNHVGWCQLVVHGYYLAPSVGDFDGDGAADAEDGWKSEPAKYKHFDRNPPRGTPVSFLGGSHDNGHRAISLGHGILRSTDFSSVTGTYAPGVVGNGTIDQVAHAMGVTYAGWSETIDGYYIPLGPLQTPKPKPKPPPTRGSRVKAAIIKLRSALKKTKRHTPRRHRIREALKWLLRIKKH